MLTDKPRVLVTTDIDWASDWLLEAFFETLFSVIPVALAFSTHDSIVIKRYVEKGLLDVGAHPNFRSNSSHGDDVKSVAQYASKLFTTHKIYRAHGFLDSSKIRTEMRNQDFLYESNILEYNKVGLKTEELLEGVTRFPCFWSDGWSIRDPDNIDGMINSKLIQKSQTKLTQPGFKVINIHPILIMTNCFSLEHYNLFRTSARNFSYENYKKFKNSTHIGVHDYFIEMLKTIEKYCDICSFEEMLT